MKTAVIAAILLSAVSACAPIGRVAPSHSVGFTGIGSGSPVVARSPIVRTSAGLGVQQTQVAVAPGPLRVSMTRLPAKPSRSSAAEAAIRAAQVRAPYASPVTFAGQPLWLNVIEVGEYRFAVLKKKAPFFGSPHMTRGSAKVFRQQIPALTGCQPGEGGYTYGINRVDVSNFAIPITCS